MRNDFFLKKNQIMKAIIIWRNMLNFLDNLNYLAALCIFY